MVILPNLSFQKSMVAEKNKNKIPLFTRLPWHWPNVVMQRVGRKPQRGSMGMKKNSQMIRKLSKLFKDGCLGFKTQQCNQNCLPNAVENL